MKKRTSFSGGGAASAAPSEGKAKKEVKSKPAGQGKITNDLIYAAGKALSVPEEDMETTTNGGVGSARKVGKDLCIRGPGVMGNF